MQPSTEQANWGRGSGEGRTLVRVGRVVGVMAVAIVLAVVTPVSAAGADKHPGPTRLWKAFPLHPANEGRLRTTSERSVPSRPPSQPVAAVPDSDGNKAILMFAVAGGATGVLLLLLLAARPVPTKKGVTMSSFIRRHSDGQSEGDRSAEAPPRIDEGVTSYTLRSARADGEPPEVSEQAGTTTPGLGIVSYDELGQTIANVLRTAEDEATQLVAAARSQAQSIREASEVEAKEARARLDAETAERRSDSERIRADANRYAEERRREADLEANQTRADAESEARKLREAGESIRRSLEEKGLARRQELMEASSDVEARLREALTTCHEVVAGIEKLLGEEPVDLDEELLQEVQEVQVVEAKTA